MDSLTLKRHNSFQNWGNWKASQSFGPRSLIFKVRQEVFKLNDICVSWNSPKTDLEINFLNLEYRSFKLILSYFHIMYQSICSSEHLFFSFPSHFIIYQLDFFVFWPIWALQLSNFLEISSCLGVSAFCTFSDSWNDYRKSG